MTGPSLFVYGTLRRGGSQHGLLADSVPLGEASWRGRLYRVAHYPGAVASPDPADAVWGEVYRLPDARAPELLRRLDRYEGPAFRRERAVVTLRAGDPHPSWIYVYVEPVERLARIISGDFFKPGA